RFPITPDTIAGAILSTKAPARVDSWLDATSELGRLVRERGIRSSVGAPVLVQGRIWGALVAASDRDEPLPPSTEARLGNFTELIATTISNAATRTELIASRARIVAAGDEARRRIERDLHDGVQQRVVALGLDIQTLRATLEPQPSSAEQGFDNLEGELEAL